MSNFPKPRELQSLLEAYSDQLEEFTCKFNPDFSAKSSELKIEADQLKIKIEKYVSYSDDDQLSHLLLSDFAQGEIQLIADQAISIASKFKELDKMFRFGQNLL